MYGSFGKGRRLKELLYTCLQKRIWLSRTEQSTTHKTDPGKLSNRNSEMLTL